MLQLKTKTYYCWEKSQSEWFFNEQVYLNFLSAPAVYKFKVKKYKSGHFFSGFVFNPDRSYFPYFGNGLEENLKLWTHEKTVQVDTTSPCDQFRATGPFLWTAQNLVAGIKTWWQEFKIVWIAGACPFKLWLPFRVNCSRALSQDTSQGQIVMLLPCFLKA